MGDIAGLIKRAAVEAVEADKPAAVMFGTADGQSTVMVEQKLRLSGEQLVVLKGVEIKDGDTVVLLREQGGQRFVLLGVAE
ncbi:MAG: DUF2577 domain-containing protein [Oscillospiraceae bacterium]|nr:DUF2577 domain-containing protein [Oscillospiraceae bacterium]